MEDMYTEKVKEHFFHPRNVGEIKNADGFGKVGNPVCGDVMAIYIKVKDDKITDIKFKTFGCTAAIATSSILTEMAKGKRMAEAQKINQQNILNALGGLPEEYEHCALLAANTLKEAIKNYLALKKTP